MKLIDFLNKIANDEIKPPVYLRLNSVGYNFLLKYLYYNFVIEDVQSPITSCKYFEKGETVPSRLILFSLNKTIEIIKEVNFMGCSRKGGKKR